MEFIYNMPGRWVPISPELMSGNAYRTLAQAAEARGFTGLCLDEHPAPVQSWLEGPGGHHCFDPFVGLAMMAGATRAIRLLTYLAVLPFRNPFMFAKQATSLDVLSDGRLTLGVGIGYMEGEFKAMGVDFDERNALFEESLEIFRKACTGQPVSHEGRHFSAENVVTQPLPVQRPHPPLWLGGNAKLTLRRVAEFGQGWLPMPRKRVAGSYHKTPPLENVEDLKGMLDYMFEHAEKVGRKAPIDVVISTAMVGASAPVDERLDMMRDYRAAGVTGFTVNSPGKTVAEEEDFLAEYGETVIAKLAAD